jgi:hypothetical protein
VQFAWIAALACCVVGRIVQAHVVVLSHPRRQQFRRLARATSRAAASALAGVAALAARTGGQTKLALALLLVAGGT